MNTQKEYKNRLRNLFFSSIKNDLEKWLKISNCNFKSPSYNKIRFDIKMSNLMIDCLEKYNAEIICRYKLFFIPIDFKVWLCARKLKKHFKNIEKEYKNIEKNKRDSNKIGNLKFGLEKLEEVFIKDIRKEKLNKINES